MWLLISFLYNTLYSLHTNVLIIHPRKVHLMKVLILFSLFKWNNISCLVIVIATSLTRWNVFLRTESERFNFVIIYDIILLKLKLGKVLSIHLVSLTTTIFRTAWAEKSASVGACSCICRMWRAWQWWRCCSNNDIIRLRDSIIISIDRFTILLKIIFSIQRKKKHKIECEWEN